MKLRNVTVLLTDNCNYNCKYCYQKKKKGLNLTPLSAKKIARFILNNSGEEIHITFSGGEPLLRFNLIEKCSFYLKKNADLLNKKVHFYILTNGSLIDDNILDFFNNYRFDVQYGFDTYLRDEKSGFPLFKNQKNILRKLLNTPNILLSTNTVFTPDNADKIFDSVKFLYNERVKNIRIGIDLSTFWDYLSMKILSKELKKTSEIILNVYKKTGEIISDVFAVKEGSGINMCGAGGSSITLTPDGGLWGCSSFYYYDWNNCKENKNDYYYGNVNDLDEKDFDNKFNEINSNYKKFKTDNFIADSNKCFLCDYLLECKLCPAIKYPFITKEKSLFMIPEHVCRINKIINNMSRNFRKEISAIGLG